MGNLEFASDNLITAMDYFKQAISIGLDAGDSAASLLANSYLCQSRVHFLWAEYEIVYNLLAQSEALFVRTTGANAHFMAQYESSFLAAKTFADFATVFITHMGTLISRRRNGYRLRDLTKPV